MLSEPPVELVELSVVVPCKNEADNLEHLFERLQLTLEPLGIPYEIICVNDGSQDNTLEKLIAFHRRDPRIKVVNLSRCYGKEIALTAGLDHASGNAVVPIDADLQDPPELIPEMLQQWRQGYQVVYAVRRSRRGESWLKRFTANGFYWLIDQLSQVRIPRNTGDFRLLDRQVVEAVKQLRERTTLYERDLCLGGLPANGHFLRSRPPLSRQKPSGTTGGCGT
jgi:glycosyltransferase involved in cell wall biosynthesis